MNKFVFVIQEEIVTLEKTLKDKEQEMVDRTPHFIELEIEFKEQTVEYEKMKKSIVSKYWDSIHF